MKKMKLFFSAIFIAMIAALSSCDPTSGIDTTDEPDTIAIAKDSLVIEVTLVPPVGAVFVFTSVEMKFWDSALSNGYIDKVYLGDVKFFRYVFYDKEAKALVGTECRFRPICDGKVNNTYYAFDLAAQDDKIITLKAGINQVVLDIITVF